MMDAIFVMQL